MPDTYKLQYDGMTLVFPGGNGFISFEEPKVIRNVVLNQQTGGTIAAAPMSGYDGDVVTLSNTATTGYTFGSYNITGATLTGNQFSFNGSDVTVKPNWNHTQYSVSLTQVAGGRISASPTTGYYGTQVTLSNTPSAEYTFGSYSITGATLTSNKFNFGTSNVTAKGSFTQKSYSITLQTDGHGKLTCNASTATGGQTVTLTPTYSSYYRFNNYSITGGSVNGNTLTVTANCTAKANFKVNAFTASGAFEKGSDVTCSAHGNSVSKTAVVPAKYATVSYHTSNVPTAWYNTSNRWKVTSTVSAYKITLNTKMGFQGQKHKSTSYSNGASVTAISLIGSTQSQSQSFTTPSKSTAVQNWAYSKSFTSNTTGVNYGVSAKLSAFGIVATQTYYDAHSKYIANRTSGTWVATGYAP